jgi:hypothetical protein
LNFRRKEERQLKKDFLRAKRSLVYEEEDDDAEQAN